MRKFTCFMLLLALLGAGFLVYLLIPSRREVPRTSKDATPASSGQPAAADQPFYYCPMHPSYTSDRPGDCPICNMSLVVRKPEDAATASAVPEHATIRVTPERRQLIGVRTGTVEKRMLERTIRAVGRVEFNEKRLSAVSLKFAGWIEEMFVKATGDLVRIGAPLFSIYSPELLEAQRNLLLALQSARGLPADAPAALRALADETLKSARDRLRLWDLTDEQIQALEASGEPERVVSIHARVRGVVTRRNVVRGGSVEPGRDLYELADLSTVWVHADVYEPELPHVQVGMKATVHLSSLPGEHVEGEVVYVYPYLNEMTRTARVRLEVSNPEERLKPGMYGDVALRVALGERLVVDDQAVLDTGTRQIVFADLGDGRFEPRQVTLGDRSDGWAVVREGLAEGERIVTSGTFLIDSESRLKAALTQAGHGGHGK